MLVERSDSSQAIHKLSTRLLKWMFYPHFLRIAPTGNPELISAHNLRVQIALAISVLPGYNAVINICCVAPRQNHPQQRAIDTRVNHGFRAAGPAFFPLVYR